MTAAPFIGRFRLAMSKIGSQALSATFLGMLVVVCFWRVFAGGVNLPVDVLYEETYPWKSQKPGIVAQKLSNRDPVHLEFPIQTFVTDSVRQLQLPLWNPLLAAGVPELGTGIFGVFYPPNVIYYVLPAVWAINIDVMLHVFLAGFFMYMYVYYISKSTFGGIIAGASFMFSGIFTLYYSLSPEYHVIPWLPLAFLCVERIFDKPRLSHAVQLGGVIAMQFLAGQMQYIFYNQFALAVYVALRCLVLIHNQAAIRSIGWPVALVALGCAAGATLGAIQLIPTLELIPLSQRVFRPYEEMIALGRSSWLSVLTAFSPSVFGDPADRNWFGPGYPSTTLVYIGVPSFLLMLIGMMIRRDAYAFVLVGLGLVSWLIALGTPAVYLLYKLIPGFSGLRHVGRAVYLYAAAGSAMAGLGADALVQRLPERADRLVSRFLLAASLIWVVMGLGMAGLAVWKQRLIPMAMELLSSYARDRGWMLVKSYDHYAERIQWMVQYELTAAAVFLAVSGTSLLLIGAWKRGWLRLVWFQAAFAGVAVAELLSYSMAHAHVVRTADFPLYQVSESVEILKGDHDKFRVASLLACGEAQAFPPNTLMPYGIEAIQAYNSFLPGRLGKFLQALEGHDASCGGEKHQNLFMLKRFHSDGMGQLLNVKYVITAPRGPLMNDPSLRLIFDGEVRIYQNLQFLPRAFFVQHASWSDEDENILDQLQRDDFDPRTLVILKGQGEARYGRLASLNGAPSGEVAIAGYRPTEITLSVDAPSDGWVVLLDTYFPGWQASVDGRPVQVHQADFAFRAVQVPAGRHQIEFRYRPLSFQVGAFLSGGAALACLIILRRDLRERVRPC